MTDTHANLPVPVSRWLCAEFMQAWRDAVQVAPHEERERRHDNVHGFPDWPRVYTLTTMEPDSDIGMRDRTVVLGDFASCRAAVLENKCDIYEGTYLLAVIEEVYPNCNYGGFGDRDAYWFAWRGQHREGGYVAIEAPALYANVSGFGVG